MAGAPKGTREALAPKRLSPRRGRRSRATSLPSRFATVVGQRFAVHVVPRAGAALEAPLGGGPTARGPPATTCATTAGTHREACSLARR
eukprot:3800892-Pyramimonas_sp.AAC.1